MFNGYYLLSDYFAYSGLFYRIRIENTNKNSIYINICSNKMSKRFNYKIKICIR